jgi:hypothetical protein
MSDDDPALWMDSLHAFPDLAQQIGQFTAAFASLEHLLWSLYGLILCGAGTDRQAIALLGHIDSFTIKLTAILNFLPYSFINPGQQTVARKLLERARQCNIFRNALAHGLYLSDDQGTRVELLSYATSTGRKPKQQQLTVPLLEREIANIFAVRDEIRERFFPQFTGFHRPKHLL